MEAGSKPDGWTLTAQRALPVICVAIAVLGTSACGRDGSSGGDTDLPSDVIAKVGDRMISEHELDTQVQALKRAQSGSGDVRPTAEQFEQQALAVLLHREWIAQEARQRGIEVSPADARRHWRKAARRQFQSKEALRQFLGGQTENDVVSQIRVQLLSEAIEEDIRINADSHPERAVKKFRTDFMSDWGDATTCRQGYRAPGCADS